MVECAKDRAGPEIDYDQGDGENGPGMVVATRAQVSFPFEKLLYA